MVATENVIKILEEGGSVVYPTDTAYGLGVDATNLNAVKKLYKIKERLNKPTHVIVSSLEMAECFAVFSNLARKIFEKYLPGPLTLVLPLKDSVPESFELLSAGTGTIGIRMPANKIALELVEALGRPVTTPSANPEGGGTPYSITESKIQFEDKKLQPDFYLEGGNLKKTKPSTIIQVVNGEVKVLREGPIKKDRLPIIHGRI